MVSGISDGSRICLNVGMRMLRSRARCAADSSVASLMVRSIMQTP